MNMVLKSSQTADLRQMYKDDDDVAKPLFDIFAARKKDVRRMTVRRASYLASATRGQIINLFRKLAEIGVGEFKMGRRGASTRIEWNFSVRSIGAAAQGKVAELKGIDDNEVDENEVEAPDNDAPWSDFDDDSIEHSFQLRPDTKVSIRLPQDFSTKEAERLAGFIRQLPCNEV
jgi:hypothetical protein